jgi:hypothetical protein
VIEVLGVGVPRQGRGWLLRRVCATLEAGELTVVTSRDPDERRALLDTVAGRLIPGERLRRWDAAAEAPGPGWPPLIEYAPLLERYFGPQHWPAAPGLGRQA